MTEKPKTDTTKSEVIVRLRDVVAERLQEVWTRPQMFTPPYPDNEFDFTLEFTLLCFDDPKILDVLKKRGQTFHETPVVEKDGELVQTGPTERVRYE